ncbi:type I-E CRISPR-associated protein Cas5/CasD [Actinomyces sp. 2119]|uniref:type I-E CRISPR-associated protein Cas5/CasD n=1 Tax=Actinomyces sp. 2119 TaxID=2321393 RepID=UPI000E6D1386|nr:type I-E CRISPR-associated protein Cas5/CasD [Actinomyces sp. 2119]RJF44814.1 type I-E CRISPR-associated protein Cas5/CasD [Actinomyces sp. 2119]
MTHSLLLLLRGPLQSWGDDSRYTIRQTRSYPGKSGVLGLLAAAQGRRRTDPVEDLARLSFGVRVDQPGRVLKEFQTSTAWQKGESTPLALVSRYYLTDAVFVAAVGGEKPLLKALEDALKRPRFPLFLGRRSCPAGTDLPIGVREGDVDTVLRAEPWHASQNYRRSVPQRMSLSIFRDRLPGEQEAAYARRRDVPLSFDPARRDYGWRDVIAADPVDVSNPEGSAVPDPFFSAVVSA